MVTQKEQNTESESAMDYAVRQGSEIADGVISGVIDAFNPFSTGSASSTEDDEDESDE